MNYQFYVCDTETTGLDNVFNDPIEISIYRLLDDTQRTWCLRPVSPVEHIQPEALRINGHKIEDLRGLTKEGRERYREASEVLIEIENWLAEDGARSEERILTGQNIQFDLNHLIKLWGKCNSLGTFPFSQRRSIDTMTIQFALDLARGTIAEGYGLKNLTKKYGIINSKAHSAEADTKATKEVFTKQIEHIRQLYASFSG